MLERQALTEAREKAAEAMALDPRHPELSELLSAVRIEEELAKAKSLLLLQSFDEALAILRVLREEQPDYPAVEQWFFHVESQKAQAERHARYEAGVGEALPLLAAGRYAAAINILGPLKAEFPGTLKYPNCWPRRGKPRK